jgi:hypothetical protein
MKQLLLTIAALCLCTTAFTQEYNDIYRSTKNPYYWKNRAPHKAYWQQDVHYKIYANIDETKNMVQGDEELEYWNNSPDTLNEVFFHLYQEAFVKNSYLHKLEKEVKFKERLGNYEKQGLGMAIEEVSVAGNTVEAELDNTIMKVKLPTPLYPGAKTKLRIVFRTYYDNGATRRRMKMYPAWGFMHYNGVQWYPKVCVYDAKFGWDTYQHLNKEFYGEFGSFDVSLNFASNYIVEATGELKNRDEMLPADLRQKLDIKNFAKKPANEAPSIITPYEKDKRKIWHFVANNVHDFAFTADPSYRIASTTWNGIECVGLAQEPHAANWQNSADYVAKIIQTFSEDIGMYGYPKMVAADAADGMEYPMLTLDGGGDPGYRGLLVHEIGHNWFYGMVGSNETYRAAMDEGFTQFLTAWGMREIDGDYIIEGKPKSKYKKKFYEPTEVKDARVYRGYLMAALNRNELPLNTHSNDFHDALAHEGGYGQVYYKTATMLYNLQYVLGDDLFLKAMQHYFDQWKFAHPYFEDFRSSIIEYTNVDLNWFFDQWLETTKTIDYKIGGIKRLPGEDMFSVTFKRKGEMQMPIDFTVTAKDGSKHNFYIPNTWFSKKTTATTLPKWYGWSKIQPEYEAKIQVPSGIRSIQIDTTWRLADKYSVNNYKSKGLPLSPKAFALKFDGGLNAPLDRKKVRLYVRPDLWWNPVDGIKAGLHLESDYMASMHKLDVTAWVNTHVLQDYDYVGFESEGYYDRYLMFNYSFNYTTPLSLKNPKLQLQINSRQLDGLWYHRAGFNWQSNDNNLVQLYGQSMWRQTGYDLDYLIYMNEWSSSNVKRNTSLNVEWTHKYKYLNGNGAYTFSLRTPMLAGNNNPFNYSYAQFECINNNRMGKLDVKTRFFARYGMGDNIPYESALFLAGANPEELMEDKYTRSKGFMPDSWGTYSTTDMNHFQQGGGLNLRGYAGYYVGDTRNGNILIAYKGRGGVSGNVEVDFDDYVKFRPKFLRNWLHLDAYLFGDAGIMQLSNYDTAKIFMTIPTNMWSDIRMDAGLGFAFTIKRWGVFDKAKPLTLRIDFPVLINKAPFANPDYAAFRWVVGVNRSF